MVFTVGGIFHIRDVGDGRAGIGLGCLLCEDAESTIRDLLVVALAVAVPDLFNGLAHHLGLLVPCTIDMFDPVHEFLLEPFLLEIVFSSSFTRAFSIFRMPVIFDSSPRVKRTPSPKMMKQMLPRGEARKTDFVPAFDEELLLRLDQCNVLPLVPVLRGEGCWRLFPHSVARLSAL